MAPSQIWHAEPHCLVHSHATRTWYYYPTQLISKPHRQNITRTLQPTGYHRRASDGSSRGTCQPDKCCAFMLLQTGQQKLAVPASRLHADCTAGTAKLHMRYPCVLGTPALPCSQLPALTTRSLPAAGLCLCSCCCCTAAATCRAAGPFGASSDSLAALEAACAPIFLLPAGYIQRALLALQTCTGVTPTS